MSYECKIGSQFWYIFNVLSISTDPYPKLFKIMFKASRDYVVGSVLDCLHDIEEIVQNKQTSQNQDLEEEDEQPGQFITTVDKVNLFMIYFEMD